MGSWVFINQKVKLDLIHLFCMKFLKIPEYLSMQSMDKLKFTQLRRLWWF